MFGLGAGPDFETLWWEHDRVCEEAGWSYQSSGSPYDLCFCGKEANLMSQPLLSSSVRLSTVPGDLL